MTARLFDAPKVRRERWTGNVLPVLAPALCPRETCRGQLVRLTPAIQPALFFFGGYGGSERRQVEACVACGWSAATAVETCHPRTGAA